MEEYDEGPGADSHDRLLFEQEIEDFKIFNRRLPTLEEEGNIWQRIEDRKKLEERQVPNDSSDL